MKKRVFIINIINFVFHRSITLRRSDAKKIFLTLMRTRFYGHRVIKHLFALILLNGSRWRQRSQSIFLSVYHFSLCRVTFIANIIETLTLRRSEINSVTKIFFLTVMTTHFYGHKVVKHLFALIIINGSRRRQKSRSIFLQFTTFHF